VKTQWRTRSWIWYLGHKPRVHGAVIVSVGIGFLVWAGWLSSQPNRTPSTPELITILGAAAALQIFGSATFGKVGHVDAEKAKSAVRRLITLGLLTARLRAELESSIESDDPTRIRDSVIRADEGFTALGTHLTDAIADWTDIHAEALEETIASLEGTPEIDGKRGSR
jgi:hypothetical protein